MQPSQLEIQREVEALRDIKRRSTAQGGPGALILDPDLPNPSSPTSPTSSYWTATTPQQLPDGDSSSGSHEGSSSSEERSAGLDDPFHLFWVPARLHPEIDPGQFSAFLKEHARTPPPDGAAGPVRSSSLSIPSTGLGRKRSMLSRQYKPSENDHVEDEDEKIVPSRPNRTPLANAPQLTISDLQRLETLAEEASKSDDPTKLRNVLRRSLSLNVSPSAMDRMDDIPDMPDEADAPIIVPPPGLILRRAARTKIRKTTLPGDGGGHRFGSGRRPRATTQGEPRTSSDLSSSDHVSSSDHGDVTETGRRPRALSNESMTSDGHTSQTDVLIDETLILEAYLCDVPDGESPSTSSLNSNPPLLSFSLAHDEPLPTQTEPSLDASTNAIILHHPQPQRLTLTTPSEELSRTPSPDASTLASSTEAIAASGLTQKTPSPVPKKEKDRKGLFKWGSDKGGKKSSKDREREKEVQRVEKDKEGGFFGSLFSSKKKADEQASQPHPYGSGREAATALLGQSKSSKQYVPSPSPQLPGGQGPYARYPIHVERAIYRLSHIKLANPRRPLYEQVLISNLMFWYLGVINKTQNSTATPVAQNQPAPTAPTASNHDDEQAERESEHREAEERQRVENERLEREREIEREREFQLQQQQPQKKESQRRGALTKPPSGSQGVRRAAEMPIKGPQYEMQHREMEQQYNGSSYGYGSPSPTPLGGGPPRMQRQSSPPVHPPHIVQPQSTNYMYPGYSGPGAADKQQFPPDSMQPTELWASSSTSGAPPRTRLTPSPPPNHAPSNISQQAPARRSRSPPAQNHNRYSANVSPAATNRVQATRGTTRSLSATATTGATPPALPAEAKTRKVNSAHAVMSTPHNRKPRAHAEPPLPLRTERGEEEDVPLAVWQQQRRK